MDPLGVYDFIADKRGRTLKASWLAMSATFVAWNVVSAPDGTVTFQSIRDKLGEIFILSVYILYVGINIKQSLRVMSKKFVRKEDCHDRHN